MASPTTPFVSTHEFELVNFDKLFNSFDKINEHDRLGDFFKLFNGLTLLFFIDIFPGFKTMKTVDTKKVV